MRRSSAIFGSLFALALAGCGTAAGTLTQPATSSTLSARNDAAVSQKSHLYTTLDVLGIGPVYSQKLNQVGVRYAADLLEAGRTRNGRANLAASTGISSKLILRWVNHADLIRILGAGPVYARMLEDAGVDTVAELAARNPQNLRESLEAVRTKGGMTMVDRMPSADTVATWIRRARDLGRYVEY
ncbi:MAG: DUF4332 domain-containing protein [Candidatus Sericytochromatia bacterium]|nr:DUF4332 domain-containing protein [Candidatus Tanganyikabacteria bacterium]